MARITRHIANQIREEYQTNPNATYEYLSDKYDLSHNYIFCILRNKTHHDPNYNPPERKRGGKKKAVYIPEHLQEINHPTTAHRARGHNHVVNKFS